MYTFITYLANTDLTTVSVKEIVVETKELKRRSGRFFDLFSAALD